jgi:hypothetical protein
VPLEAHREEIDQTQKHFNRARLQLNQEQLSHRQPVSELKAKIAQLQQDIQTNQASRAKLEAAEQLTAEAGRPNVPCACGANMLNKPVIVIPCGHVHCCADCARKHGWLCNVEVEEPGKKAELLLGALTACPDSGLPDVSVVPPPPSSLLPLLPGADSMPRVCATCAQPVWAMYRLFA